MCALGTGVQTCALPIYARRMAVPAGRAHALQHRHDGHGRAALQFRQCPRRAEDRHGRRRPWPLSPPDHAFDLRRGSDDGQSGRGDWHNLAVSLHAVTKEVRDEIVPLNRKYGIEELLQACADYPGANNARRITFEYVMLKDKNDSDEDARELVRLIRKYKLPAKVNLIPFNPWPGAPYECSSDERVQRFSDIVFEAGISAPIRRPRGRDIMAACGQLKSASEKKSRAELDRLAEEKLATLSDA